MLAPPEEPLADGEAATAAAAPANSAAVWDGADVGWEEEEGSGNDEDGDEAAGIDAVEVCG